MQKFILSLLSVMALILWTTVVAFAAAGSFPDIDPNAFYADAAGSVAKKGLITGYQDGRFGPNDSVTRGQLAVILERYEKMLDSQYEQN